MIEAGKTVIIQKYNYMRTHVLNPKKNLQLGRDIVDISGIVGHQFGTTFRMVSDTNKKVFSLEKVAEVVDFESIFLSGESGNDNRDLVDDEKSQKLSKKEIEGMRDDGVTGKEIVGKLIENSETFQNKTKFSQEKFLKKKAKKYHQYILIRRPSIRLLMQIHYKADPMKLMNLRQDSLAQILNSTNIQPGGRYIVYETGAQGVVVSAVLERVGRVGSVVHVYQTGQPQTQCLGAMNFDSEVMETLATINIQHLRSLEQGRDILENHGGETENGKTSGEGVVKNGDDNEPPHKKSRPDSEIKDLNSAVAPPEAMAANDHGSQPQPKPVRMNLREKSVAAYRDLCSAPCDGLVIVCKQHPSALLLYLAKFVAPSRPFAVFSPYKEPLMSAYLAVKEAGRAVLCTVSETWLRSSQVLPGRTHPEMLMSGGGGYLLTGTFVEP